MLRVRVVHLIFFCIEVNLQRIFKCETNYVGICKYNNYKFWDLTFFEGINKYSLRKLSASKPFDFKELISDFKASNDEYKK